MRILVLSLLLLLLAGGSRAQEFATTEIEGLSFGEAVDRVTAIAVGDLDGDERVDLAATVDLSGTLGRVRVLYREEDGSFSPVDYLNPEGTSRTLALADLNNDGLPEIVTAQTLNKVVVLWNEGGRAFEREVIDETGGSHFLQVVDIDRDGKLDLLSAIREGSARLAWYTFNRGSPSFRHWVDSYFADRAFTAQAGNLDDDDDLELVASTAGGYHVLDWDQSADPPWGSFVNPVPLTPAADGRHVILKDLNRDGRLDIAMAVRNLDQRSQVLWMKNEGGLSFSTHELAVDPHPGFYYRWIEAVDLDNDGDPDLAVSRFDPGNRSRFVFFLNDGSGSFSKLEYWPRGDRGGGMFQFAIWPDFYADGRPVLVPTRAFGAQAGSWPIVSLVPKLLARVRSANGQLIVSWESRPGFLYRLEFSEDLETWSEGYLSGGTPAEIDSQQGDGTELTQDLVPPDTATFYVRVIGEQQPPE